MRSVLDRLRATHSQTKRSRISAIRDFNRSPRPALRLVAAVAVVALASACPPAPNGPPQPAPAPLVPTNAQDSCPLSAATFASWFQSGTVSVNGVVNPANSLVAPSPNCGFYQWSEQMFMWLTSPAPATYGGGGGRIMDSPTFFDVSPADASGARTLVGHSPGLVGPLGLRAAQVGPHRLPVIVDRAGQLLEIEPPDPKVQPTVRDATGAIVPIAHVKLDADGRPILIDASGKTITAPLVESVKAGADPQGIAVPLVRKFVIDGFPIFIDPLLQVIDVEPNQADGGVLEAQTAANGSLVYYVTVVNDVYAYFLTGLSKGAVTTTTPNQFPTTQADLTSILAFAAANGRTAPPDPDAMAVEVKTSWVLAAGLPNLSSYITRTATVPVYNTSNPGTWTTTGQQTVQVALVGIHVVGSTAGHPEMVWATFEHAGNTPAASYSYTTTAGASQTVAQSTTGTWLFSSNGSTGPFNAAHMSSGGPPADTIQSNSPFTISPSDTLRLEPWGLDGTNAFSNTQVISTNANVLSMMGAGDVRGNYVLTGATWTIGGANPVGATPGVGTNLLTNTTMETYQQQVTNCFTCHQSGSTLTTGVSHVFSAIKPLF
jgi:hypothetical protein